LDTGVNRKFGGKKDKKKGGGKKRPRGLARGDGNVCQNSLPSSLGIVGGNASRKKSVTARKKKGQRGRRQGGVLGGSEELGRENYFQKNLSPRVTSVINLERGVLERRGG